MKFKLITIEAEGSSDAIRDAMTAALLAFSGAAPPEEETADSVLSTQETEEG